MLEIRSVNGTLIPLLATLLAVAWQPLSAQPRIEHGPYLQHPSASGVTIVWHTNRPGVSRVEYGVGGELNRTAVSSRFGLIANDRTRHVIHLTGLEPGTTYGYRVVTTEFLGYVRQHIASFGETVTSEAHSFTTLDPGKEAFSFVFVSDLHQRADDLAGRIAGPAWEGTDFAFFGGDMINDFMEPDQLFDGFLDVAVEGFARERPFLFVRGNHETRGRYARELFEILPVRDGRPYFSFRHGDACFLVLDSGEDKEDGHEYYNGLVDFDRFRREQAEWLRGEVQSPCWTQSRFRIAVSHIPPRGGDGYAIGQVRERFESILDGAGTDLWLSGHMHRYLHLAPTPGEHAYHLVVTDDRTSLKVFVSPEGVRVTVIEPDGTVADDFRIDGRTRAVSGHR